MPLLFLVVSLSLEPLLALGMYLLLSKIPSFLWWVLLVIFLIMFFGKRTYNQAVADKGEADVIRFWYVARSIIFMTEVLAVIGMYAYIFLR